MARSIFKRIVWIDTDKVIYDLTYKKAHSIPQLIYYFKHSNRAGGNLSGYEIIGLEDINGRYIVDDPLLMATQDE